MDFLEQILEVTEKKEAKNAIQEALTEIRLSILNKRFKNHELENPKPDPELAKTSKSETDHSAIPVSITSDELHIRNRPHLPSGLPSFGGKQNEDIKLWVFTIKRAMNASGILEI